MPQPRPTPIPLPRDQQKIEPVPLIADPIEAPLEKPLPPRPVEVMQDASVAMPSQLSPTKLPSLQVAPSPDTADLSPLPDRAAPSQITTSIPSLKAQPEPEKLTQPSSVQAPASISNTPPSLVQTPTSVQAAQAANSREQDLIQRRRKEEDEATSGLPSSPMPRIANPVVGAPAASAGQSSPVPGIADAWRVTPSSQGGHNARALRTSPLGCRSRDRLTASEQALCDERFNADATIGAQTPIRGSGNAERDARFEREGARQRYNYEARRRSLSGGTGNVGPADCPGSNLGTGCAGSLLDPTMQMDSSANVRTKRDGPPPAGRPVTPGSAGNTGRPGNGTEQPQR